MVKEYRAYIIPDVELEGVKKNLVIRSNFGLKLFLDGINLRDYSTYKLVIYKLSGIRPDFPVVNFLESDSKIETEKEFSDAIKSLVGSLPDYGIEEKLIKFAKDKNLVLDSGRLFSYLNNYY